MENINFTEFLEHYLRKCPVSENYRIQKVLKNMGYEYENGVIRKLKKQKLAESKWFAFEKVRSVIRSCETIEQLNTAMNMIINYRILNGSDGLEPVRMLYDEWEVKLNDLTNK